MAGWDDLTAGDVFGAYRVESKITTGGMSTLYLATDTRLDRRVALKLLASRLAADESFRKRFVNEGRVASRIDHPNIIPIYECGEHDGALFIAMRFVDNGTDLRSLILDGDHPSPEVTVALMRQAAGALDTVHANGIVHRDVKPDNFLLAPSDSEIPHLYLTDFGITRTIAEAGFTRDGVLLGTLNYLSPEQIQRQVLSPQSDQYALGCVAYELLTGCGVFDGENEGAVVLSHLRDPIPSVLDREPGLPAGVDAVLAKATSKDPAARYPTCADLVKALAAALDGEHVPVTAGITAFGQARRRDAVGSGERNNSAADTQSDLDLAGDRTRDERRPSVAFRSLAVILVAAVVAMGTIAAVRARGGAPTHVFSRLRLPSGIAIDRSWELLGEQGTALASTTRVSNPTDRDLAIDHDEIVPKAVAEDVDQVRFATPFDSVIRRDPIVRYALKLPAKGEVVLRYDVDLAPDGSSGERLNDLAAEWKAEFKLYKTDAQAPPSVRDAEEETDGDLASGPGTSAPPGTDGATTTVFDDGKPFPFNSTPPRPRTTSSTSAPPTIPPTTPRPTLPTPTVTVTTPGNRAPILTLPGASTLNEEEAFDVSFGATDPDGDPLTFTVTDLPPGLAAAGNRITGVVPATGLAITLRWWELQAKVFDVKVKVADNKGASAEASFALTVVDSHLIMPTYFTTYACGEVCGETMTPPTDWFDIVESDFVFIEGQEPFPDWAVWYQSATPDVAIAYGSQVVLHRWRDPCPVNIGCRDDIPAGWG